MHNPFHLAIEVHNLDLARAFYVKVLGCEEGRSDLKWIDFNLFGHQLVCHLNENMDKARVANLVDGEEVPIPHFGVILAMDEWKILADRLVRLKIKFVNKVLTILLIKSFFSMTPPLFKLCKIMQK